VVFAFVFASVSVALAQNCDDNCEIGFLYYQLSKDDCTSLYQTLLKALASLDAYSIDHQNSYWQTVDGTYSNPNNNHYWHYELKTQEIFQNCYFATGSQTDGDCTPGESLQVITNILVALDKESGFTPSSNDTLRGCG